MKHLLTLLFALPALAEAQTLVSTDTQLRTALLEEFTAIRCGNCPAALATAEDLFTQYGDQLYGIEVHGGPLAAPTSGQPDFRTPDGTALWAMFGVAFQPQGMVNRGALSGAAEWNAAIGNIITQDSPANIGIASTVEGDLLMVNVEVYYTSTPANSDELHVALIQDHIVGYQQDYVNGANQNYDHRNVLRDMITDVAGDPVVTNTNGTLVERTYTLTLDPTWTIADLHVVAFVGPTSGAIYQVKQVNADGGFTTTINETRNSELELGLVYPVPASNEVYINVNPATTGNVLFLRDALGREVARTRVATGATNVVLNVKGLKSGMYYASFAGGLSSKVVVE